MLDVGGGCSKWMILVSCASYLFLVLGCHCDPARREKQLVLDFINE